MFQFETSIGKKNARIMFVPEKNIKFHFHIRSLLFLAFLPKIIKTENKKMR